MTTYISLVIFNIAAMLFRISFALTPELIARLIEEVIQERADEEKRAKPELYRPPLSPHRHA
jgi:hypothetical protein